MLHSTPTPLLLLFIQYKSLVCIMIKFRIKEEKKNGGQYNMAATKRLSFFLSIKAYVKRSDVAYF